VDDMSNPNFEHPNPRVIKLLSDIDSKHLAIFQFNATTFTSGSPFLFSWNRLVFNGYFQELDVGYPSPHWVNSINPKMPFV
jgi:hypothetical protein